MTCAAVQTGLPPRCVSTSHEGAGMNVHTAIARNFSAESENRMHSDGEARQFGFNGALVPGVAVFGHMTRPLVAALGAGWFSGHTLKTRFLKPAYDGDELTIECAAEGAGHLVRCRARGELLAELRSTPGVAPLDAMAAVAGGEAVLERPEAVWPLIEVGRPFPAFQWHPDMDEHRLYASQVADDLPLYGHTDLLHPHALLSTANTAFSNRFQLPAWLHVGSEVAMHAPVRIGDELEVRATPVEKWRRKGHEFVTLYIVYANEDTVKTEIRHTAIFNIARKAA